VLSLTRGALDPLTEGSAINTGVSDAISVLRWGLRHYTALFVACVISVAVIIPLLIAQGGTRYDASALVVAQRLDMDLTALPRYAEATFGNGEVARAAAVQLGGNAQEGSVIPGQVSLQAEQDSIVLQVVGHADSAQGAADLANTAAAAFVAQLNLPGEGVGTFNVQSEAVPPAQPVARLAGTPVALAVGLAAGVFLGLALVSLLLVLRRPVLDAADAAELTGVPVLGTVTLLRMRPRQLPAAGEVSGLVPACRRLLAMHPEIVLLMHAGKSEALRRQLCVAMARVLGRVRPVRLVAAPEVGAAAQGFPGEDVILSDVAGPLRREEPGAEITLVDGPSPLDVVAPSGTSAAILVVAHGVSERVLRAAVSEHLGGLASDRLLMVQQEGRRRPAIASQFGQPMRNRAPSGVGPPTA